LGETRFAAALAYRLPPSVPPSAGNPDQRTL